MSGFYKRKIDAVGKSSNGINLTWNDDDAIVGFDIVPKKKVKKEKKTTDKDGRPAQAKTNKGGKQKTRQNKRTRRIKSTR